MITRTLEIAAGDRKYILALPYTDLKDDQVTTWDDVVRRRAAVLKMLGDHPSSGSVVDVPYILEVVSYVEPTKKMVPQQKVEKRVIKKRRTFTPTFHHPTQEISDKVVEFDEDPTITLRVAPSTEKYVCYMCSEHMQEVHATKGAFLSYGNSTKKYYEVNRQTKSVVEFEKHIKFPMYKSGWVCPSCISEFTRLCSSYDANRNIKAKLMFVTLKVKDTKESVTDMGTTKTFTETAHDLQDDEIKEVVDLHKTSEPKLKFHTPLDFDNSPQEIKARRSKVKRLDPVLQDVNPKPSRRPKDYQKKHRS